MLSTLNFLWTIAMQLQDPLPQNTPPLSFTTTLEQNSTRASRRDPNQQQSVNEMPEELAPFINDLSQQLSQQLEVVNGIARIDEGSSSFIDNITFLDADGDNVVTVNDDVLIRVVEGSGGNQGELDNRGANGELGDTVAVGSMGVAPNTGIPETFEEKKERKSREVILSFELLLKKINGIDEIIGRVENPTQDVAELEIYEKTRENMMEMMMFQMYEMNKKVIDDIKSPPDFSLSEEAGSLEDEFIRLSS